MIFSPVSILSSRRKGATYIGFSGFTNDASSYSLSATLDVGFYAVAIQWESTTNRSLTGVTFNGVSATRITNSGDLVGTAIAYIQTTQPSNDIVINFNNSVVRAGVALWRIDGIGSQTPITQGGVGGSITTSLDVTVGDAFPFIDGVGIGIATNSNQASDISWTAVSNQPGRVVPITDNYDIDIESLVNFGGCNFYMADGNNVTITSNFGAEGAGRLLVVVWN